MMVGVPIKSMVRVPHKIMVVLVLAESELIFWGSGRPPVKPMSGS